MLARTALRAIRGLRAFSSRPAVGALQQPPVRFMSQAGQTEVDVGPNSELIRDFLKPADFYDMLGERGVNFFTGVPDSLLKDFLGYVNDHVPQHRHIITSNEGSAVAVAAGYYMSTRRIPLVYLQNSGLGNTVNPLLSLADPQVYSIPMLLLVGWRGEPGKRDEPQHRVQGALTPGMLASMNIMFEVLPDFKEGAAEALDTAFNYMQTRNSPYVLLVKRQNFEKYSLKNKPVSEHPMTREDSLRVLLKSLSRWDVVVSTTGFTSREVFELRDELGHDHSRDFLTVGSMGHCSAIALGLALGKPSRRIFCLDGDGGMLMHMGNVATIGSVAPENLVHIVVNNAAHESVGGQPTGAAKLDIPTIARGCGYQKVLTATTEEQLTAAVDDLSTAPGPSLLEVKVKMGTRKDLGRPTTTPVQNRNAFMRFLDA